MAGKRASKAAPLPLKWQGTPGVHYPGEVTAPGEVPSSREWLTLAEAAEVLHLSTARTRQRLEELGTPTLRTAEGVLYYKRSTVLAMVGTSDPCTAIPPGWCSVEAAVKLMGRSRTTLDQWADKGRIRQRKVYMGSRYRCLYHEGDVAELRDLLTMRDAINARLEALPS